MKSVLLTGSSGFLGKYFVKSLQASKKQFLTLGRSSNVDIVCDLSVQIPHLSNRNSELNSVIHCAGLAHQLPKTDSEKEEFFRSHMQGMKNLLQGLEDQSAQKFIFISTVAVYGLEKGELMAEDTMPQPNTPYGQAKLEAENILIKWCQSRRCAYWILRPPLIMGDNPPGNLGKLIRAIKKNMYVFISGINPQKSMVHAEDIANFIVKNLDHCTLENSGIYNVTDGIHPDLKSVSEYLIQKYNPKFVRITLPLFLLKLAAKIGDILPFFPLNSLRLEKLSQSLTFSDEKARKIIDWDGKTALR